MRTAGELLKSRRKSLGKTVFEVSQETKIQEKYIKALEANEFSQFDSSVFVKGFLKIYSDYLKVDSIPVLALYRRQCNIKEEVPKKGRTVLNLKSFFSPLTISLFIIIFLVIAVMVYLYIQFYNLQKIPALEIFSPVNGEVSNSQEIVVKGKTNEDAILNINGEEIGSQEGEFEYSTKLQLGDNTITISAINPNNNKQINSQSLLVKYELPKKEEVAGEKTQTYVTVQIKIKTEPAWITLNIDGKQQIAAAVSPKTTNKYKAYESIEYVTGKPQTTYLYIDGKEVAPKIIKDSQNRTYWGQECSINKGIVNCSE